MQCSVNEHRPSISPLDNLLFLATLWNLKASPSIQHRPITRRHPTWNTPADSIRMKRQPWTRPIRTITRVRWILPAAWRRIIRPVPMQPSTRPKVNWRRVNNRWRTSLPSPNDFWNNTVSHLILLTRDEREANSISGNIFDLDTTQLGCVSSLSSTGGASWNRLGTSLGRFDFFVPRPRFYLHVIHFVSLSGNQTCLSAVQVQKKLKEMVPKQGKTTVSFQIEGICDFLSSQSSDLLAKSRSIGHCLQCFTFDHRYLHVSLIVGRDLFLAFGITRCRWTLQIVQLRDGHISWPRSGRCLRVGFIGERRKVSKIVVFVLVRSSHRMWTSLNDKLRH